MHTAHFQRTGIEARHPMATWRPWIAGALLSLAAALPASAQPYINVTVGGAFAPGVYGQIAVGNNPLPPLINTVPVVVGPPVYGAGVMYVYVSDLEYREWPRYCGYYGACGRPVYFVRADPREPWWVRRNEYLRGPGYYREPPRAYPHRDRDRDHDRRDRDGDRHEGRRDRGPDRGHGR
jgi:hypothetical protein